MQYDSLIYNSGPTNIKDYVNNRYNIVHNQLYEDALHNYVYNFTKDIIMKQLLYNLFNCMNNCITPYNDEENIINIQRINELKNNQLYRIFTIEEIKENNLYNTEYINLLNTYMNENGYDLKIQDVFNLLCIDENNKNDYITYIIVNIVSLIYDIKQNIKNTINYQLDINNDFSDFIIRYKNTLYIINENTDITSLNELTEEDLQNNLLLYTEKSDNEIFIYEDQYKMDYHIGYNSDGYFILDINPEIDITSNYDKLYYIMSYINYLLLNFLFNDICDRFINNNLIIEKPQNEYYLPSSIIIYEKKYPYKKKIVDLSPYWSNYNDHSDINIEDIKYTNEELRDAHIENIDYINGTVKIYSKMRDQEYTVNTRYINENTIINDDIVKNTFSQKIKNIHNIQNI